MSKVPNPTPPKLSGGINAGDLSGERDVNFTLTDVAGGDQFKITNSPGATISTTYIQTDQRPPLFLGVPSMPNHFLGREDLIGKLVPQLTGGDSLMLSAEGLPGVGKTTIAIAIAYRQDVLAHFSDGVLWGSLGHIPDVLSTLGQWAEALGGDVTHLVELQARQDAVRTLIGQKRLLIIIDDAWQLEAARHLRCGGPHCVHLLTTRDKGIARGFAGNYQLTTVPPLDDDPAFLLLKTLAGEACTVDPVTARQLALAVGGLPLALELLGGYLADPHSPERTYFPQASQAALDTLTIPAQRLQLASQRLGSHGGPITLQATIELSLADLPSTSRDAFYALGAFAPKPATFSLEAALAVTAAAPRDLARLIERNQLDWDQGRLTLHQTLADVAMSQLPPEAPIRHWHYYLVQASTDRYAWQRIQAHYEQIQWAWHHTPDTPDILELLWVMRIYQGRRGLWADYLDWANRGLTLCQTHGLLANQGTLLNNIGRVYDSLGQRQTALGYYERALPITEAVGSRIGQATTLNNIGTVYDNLGQRQTALEYYERALPIWEKVGDRASQAVTLSSIGLVYDNLGERQTALEYYMRALPIREEMGDHAGQATTLNNIGTVHDNLGEHQTALEYYMRALPIREEVGDRIGQGVTLNNIGTVYDNLGERQTALVYYQQALPIMEEVGNRFGEAITRYNMAQIYRIQGDLPEAINQLRQVVALDRLVQHPDLEDDTALLAQLEAELTQ